MLSPAKVSARGFATPALLCVGLSVSTSPARGADAPEITPAGIVYGAAPGVGFSGPMGVAIDQRRGEVLVANTGAHQIEIYDMTGRFRARYIHRVRGRDARSVPGEPGDLAIDAAGHTLVVDLRAPYVDVLDFRGWPVAKLDVAMPRGGCGPAPSVTAIAVTPQGTILVATGGDSSGIRTFDRLYRPTGCWGVAGRDSGRLHVGCCRNGT